MPGEVQLNLVMVRLLAAAAAAVLVVVVVGYQLMAVILYMVAVAVVVDNYLVRAVAAVATHLVILVVQLEHLVGEVIAQGMLGLLYLSEGQAEVEAVGELQGEQVTLAVALQEKLLT
jgi:hypothetical protein